MTPVQQLSLAYASEPLRSAMSLLLELDTRMSGLVLTAREPVMAQLRLAWWREQLEKPAEGRPMGEPWLAALGELESTEGDRMLTNTALAVLEAWEIRAASEEFDKQTAYSFAALRGQIFSAAAQITGQSAEHDQQIAALGRRWAVWSAGYSGLKTELKLKNGGDIRPLPRQYRALSMLALGARLEAEQAGLSGYLRLLWHGLTGR